MNDWREIRRARNPWKRQLRWLWVKGFLTGAAVVAVTLALFSWMLWAK